MIYFIQLDIPKQDGPIKIGYSNNTKGVFHRLYKHQVSSPYNVKLKLILPGGKEIEKKIHSFFRQEKIRGEWFSPSDDLILFISSFAEFSETVKREYENKYKTEFHLDSMEVGNFGSYEFQYRILGLLNDATSAWFFERR